MNSRKDSILEKITGYTRESILDNSFSFEHCNAFDIALELKIDRSNVSRILNQLFNEYQLIKISGRPTTYLSREVIVNEFRYAKAPQILESKEALKEQLAFNAPMSGNTMEEFKIIGSGTGESLREVIDKVLPCFIYPQTNPLLIILFGEMGSGKKHFCEQLFQYGIKKKTFRKQSRYFSITYNRSAADNHYILDQIQTDTTAMILIEVFDFISESAAYHIKSDISNLFHNSGSRQPLIIFLVAEGVADQKAFSSLTPCIARFPSLSQRTPVERTKLILSFMQEAANTNHTHFRFNHEVLIKLLSANYKYDIFQLQNEICYAVSNSIYFARDNFATLLPHFLSGEVRKNQSDNATYVRELTTFVENNIPPFLDFYPDASCSLLELLTSDSGPSIRLPKIKMTFHGKVLDDVLRSDVLLTDQIVDERLHSILRFCFTQTRMEHDIPMLNRLYAIIQEMIDGTFIIDCLEDQEMPVLSKAASKAASSLIERVQIAFHVSLSKSYRDYLRLFIEYTMDALNKSCVTYIFIAHTRQIAQDYALYMNYISGTRSYYAMDFTEEDQKHYSKFTKKAKNIIGCLDESKELVIVSDKAPLINLSTLMVAGLNRPILSLYPISLPMLMMTARIIKEENLHAVPAVRKVIYTKKDFLRAYNAKITGFPNEYISQVISRHFEHFFDSVNTTLTNKIFYGIIKNVFDRFDCELTTGLVLESLLHANFLISRSLQREEIIMDNQEGFIQEYAPLYEFVKDQLAQTRELLSLNISEKEIIVLCELFINDTSAF